MVHKRCVCTMRVLRSKKEMKYICVYITGIHEMRSERDEC